MLHKLQKKSQGFTIIEVLIVLAIAGLIMLVVFLAVPALQRNQRNNARNADASRIAALITECLANRNGETDECNSANDIGFDADDYREIESASFANTNQPSQFGSTIDVRVNFESVCVDGGGDPKALGNERQFTVAFVNEPAINRCIGSE